MSDVRVLIVDDQPSQRKMHRTLIEDISPEITVADFSDPVEALLVVHGGGAYGVRTRGLLLAKQSRYQLRQPPEVETGFEPVYTDLQSVASPLGHSTG